MSQRIVRCKKCNSRKLTKIEEKNPDTHDMNMIVVCRCEDCGEVGEYRETSPRYRKLFNRGLVRL